MAESYITVFSSFNPSRYKQQLKRPKSRFILDRVLHSKSSCLPNVSSIHFYTYLVSILGSVVRVTLPTESCHPCI